MPTLAAAVAVLFVFGLSWSIPLANLTPMALELDDRVARRRAGRRVPARAEPGGLSGPSLVGEWFERVGSRRSLFVLLAAFLAGAFALLASLGSGFGERVRRRIRTPNALPPNDPE